MIILGNSLSADDSKSEVSATKSQEQSSYQGMDIHLEPSEVSSTMPDTDEPYCSSTFDAENSDSCSENSLTNTESYSDSSEDQSESYSYTSDNQSEDSDTSSSSNKAANICLQPELNLLACFLRNNLPATACKDIISTFQKSFPKDSNLKQINYERLWKSTDSDYAHEVHYCEICGEVFPSDPDIVRCRKVGCRGIRYHGQNQHIRRKPRASFVLANLKEQLENLLQAPG